MTGLQKKPLNKALKRGKNVQGGESLEKCTKILTAGACRDFLKKALLFRLFFRHCAFESTSENMLYIKNCIDI